MQQTSLSTATVVILAGLPGSGKSTLATHYAQEGYMVVSTDAIREAIFPDNLCLRGLLSAWHEERKSNIEFITV